MALVLSGSAWGVRVSRGQRVANSPVVWKDVARMRNEKCLVD